MPIDDPFGISADEYIVVQTTTVEDGLQQVEAIHGPQPYVEALFNLNDQFIDLIQADNGYAFDADTARSELEQLGYGEEFEAHVGDRSYLLLSTEEELDNDQGYSMGI